MLFEKYKPKLAELCRSPDLPRARKLEKKIGKKKDYFVNSHLIIHVASTHTNYEDGNICVVKFLQAIIC